MTRVLRKVVPWIALLGVAATLLLTGCSTTLAVTVPKDMSFLSTGDFTPGVRTLGLVQEKKTVLAPLFIVNLNAVRQELYEELLDKARDAGATGVTNVRFSWVPSPWTALTAYILSPVIDFYVEGFAIVER